MLTGEDMAAARSRARLTQQQLADRIGVTLRSVGNWERSQTVPSGAEARVREALAAQLGHEPDPLTAVSDARLLAEIAARFERTRKDRDDDVPATNTQAGASPATTTAPTVNARTRRGKSPLGKDSPVAVADVSD